MKFAPLHTYLSAQLAAGQVSHAYIFSGAGAEEQALALAAALVCPQPDDAGNACGCCAVCCNLAAGTYPDCRVAVPAGGQHKVENMRELVAAAGLSPMYGARKVFIVREAEKINEEAANTLLKLLEEPSPDTALILVSAQPDALLPTILSRCQLFIFGMDSAQGEPELPPEMLEQAEEMLLALPEMPAYQVLIRARDYEKDRELQKLFLFALLKVLHRAARGESRLPMHEAQLLRSANAVESALTLIGKNVNQKLLTDVIYLRLWQNCAR